jgi:hypothetical protein
MPGRHSLEGSLVFDSEPERILRRAHLGEEKEGMAEQGANQQRTLRDYFIPTNQPA